MKKIVTTIMIMICSLFMTGLMNNSVNAGQLDKNESYVLEKISEDKFPACQSTAKIYKSAEKLFLPG